jgi:hypothetical protein
MLFIIPDFPPYKRQALLEELRHFVTFAVHSSAFPPIMRVQVGDPLEFAERRLSRFSLPNQSASSRIVASQYEGSIHFTR